MIIEIIIMEIIIEKIKKEIVKINIPYTHMSIWDKFVI